MNELKETIKRFAEALTKAVPLLSQYAPPGWIDFREGTPLTLRRGLFSSVEDEENDDASSVRFTAGLASRLAATVCVSQLNLFLSDAMIDGGERKWCVRFSVQKSMMAELANAIDPPPERLWQVSYSDLPIPTPTVAEAFEHWWNTVGSRRAVHTIEGILYVDTCRLAFLAGFGTTGIKAASGSMFSSYWERIGCVLVKGLPRLGLRENCECAFTFGASAR